MSTVNSNLYIFQILNSWYYDRNPKIIWLKLKNIMEAFLTRAILSRMDAETIWLSQGAKVIGGGNPGISDWESV